MDITKECYLKGARSCNFRQFEQCSNGHGIYLNIKGSKLKKNSNKTQDSKEGAFDGQTWRRLRDCIWVNFFPIDIS